MAKVFDYESFSANKQKNYNTNMSFSAELRYVDIDVFNRAKEVEEANSIECEIDYGAYVTTSKTGIDRIDFVVTSIELEFKVDSDKGEKKEMEYEIDIVPNKNIEEGSITCQNGEIIIPSEPSRIEIDMAQSMNPRDFKIVVTFGNDR